MKGRNVHLSVVIVVALIALAVFVLRRQPPARELFDRTPDKVLFTRDALCRMDCRGISREEVEEIMQKGIIHLNKSNRRKPCPLFALQGRTRSGEHLRVIFAQCRNETRVVTTDNLEKDFECHCPGEEKTNPLCASC